LEQKKKNIYAQIFAENIFSTFVSITIEINSTPTTNSRFRISL